MKKIISLLIFCMLLTTPAMSEVDEVIGCSDCDEFLGATLASGVDPCDDCSGDLSFAWHCEDLTVTSGTPCGCVDATGDSVTSATGAADLNADVTPFDGTYSCDFPQGTDYYEFDVSSDDLISDDAGTIEFELYVTTWDTGSYLFQAFGSASPEDLIRLEMTGTDEIKAVYVGNNDVQIFSTVDANISTGSWYTIKYTWTQANVDPNQTVTVEGTLRGSDNDNCVGFSTPISKIRIGAYTEQTGDVHIDNIKIYKTVQ
jgi:hypothetical protein